MRTRDPESKRQLLLDAALTEFATYGVAGARVDRLAQQAGISPGSVYSFYAGKDELFDAVFDNIVQIAGSSVPMDADHLPEYAAQLYDIGLRYPQVRRFLSWYQLERADRGAPVSVAGSMAEKITAIKDAQRRGAVKADVPAAQLLALVLTIANMWSHPSEDLIALVPPARRRRVIIDAVSRLIEP